MPRSSGLLLALLVAAPPAIAGDADFSLTSPELKPGGRFEMRHVYNGSGCSGGNLSPALRWSGAPSGTKSFGLTVFDPDARGGWWHWVVFDIPASANGLAAGAGDPGAQKAPAGVVQATSDFGKPGFGGPCPPSGEAAHRYVFTLYALKVDRLAAGGDGSPAAVASALAASALAKATFTVYYGR